MFANLRAGLAWLWTGLAWTLFERIAAIVRWRDRLVRGVHRHALRQPRWR
jgi:hypothetical protein